MTSTTDFLVVLRGKKHDYTLAFKKDGNVIKCNNNPVVIKKVADLDEDEKEHYDTALENGERQEIAQLRASLFWFNYHKKIDHQPKYAYVLDELVLRFFDGKKMFLSYQIDMVNDEVKCFGTKDRKPFKSFKLPTTGSDMACFDFSDSVQSLHLVPNLQ
jgi:hypothetical protein